MASVQFAAILKDLNKKTVILLGSRKFGKN
jgi:hypothetical protein